MSAGEAGPRAVLAATLSMLGEGMKDLGPLTLAVKGSSMEPTLRAGDSVTFEHAGPGDLRPGDIVCFRIGEVACVHRLISVSRGPDGVRILSKGDNRFQFDEPFGPERLLGRVVAVAGRPLRASPWVARLSAWQGAYQAWLVGHEPLRRLGDLKVRLLGHRSLALGAVKLLSRLASPRR